jgi:predicted RND superfamily exporter protein
MIPLGLGMIWTAGLMWLFHLKFNLANMIVVPLILGIGVENGIHMVHRYREEGEGGATLVTGSTGQSVVLFSLTTMIGFGSLMLAKHYGVFSMGLLLMLAVGSVLIASLTVLPLLLSRSSSSQPRTIAEPQFEEEDIAIRRRAAR